MRNKAVSSTHHGLCTRFLPCLNPCPDVEVESNKPFPPQVALVTVFCHGNSNPKRDSFHASLGQCPFTSQDSHTATREVSILTEF